jgi:hypothetical protein
MWQRAATLMGLQKRLLARHAGLALCGAAYWILLPCVQLTVRKKVRIQLHLDPRYSMILRWLTPTLSSSSLWSC